MSQAFITLKDHKEDFSTHPKCRLIDPAKSELGKVSKKIIENINASIKTKTGANQWKNTDDVLKWFNDISDKPKCTFVQFDIEEYYPSISRDLLMKAIEYARLLVG